MQSFLLGVCPRTKYNPSTFWSSVLWRFGHLPKKCSIQLGCLKPDKPPMITIDYPLLTQKARNQRMTAKSAAEIGIWQKQTRVSCNILYCEKSALFYPNFHVSDSTKLQYRGENSAWKFKFWTPQLIFISQKRAKIQTFSICLEIQIRLCVPHDFKVFWNHYWVPSRHSSSRTISMRNSISQISKVYWTM